MSKNIFLTTTVIILSFLIAACGSAESDQRPDSSDQPSPTETTDTPGETEEPGIVEEEPSNAEKNGKLTESDEQFYAMYVVPGYQLVSEEPGKDALLLEEDSSVFMRIETFTKEDIEFAQAESAMKETLAAVNPDSEITEAQAPQGIKFLNSVAYEIPSAEGKVTGIVYEKEKLIVRLTIFDSTNANATEDFVDMGGTIDRP